MSIRKRRADRKHYIPGRSHPFCVRLLLRENRFQVTADDVDTAWRELQAEDARRAAEGATDLTYEEERLRSSTEGDLTGILDQAVKTGIFPQDLGE